MAKKRLLTCLILLAFLVFRQASAPALGRGNYETPELISLTEAEILVYLLPAAHEVRRQGMDVGWEMETSPRLKREDFFTFWVVNAKRPHVDGSVTIGFFSVNKHTADIWDHGLEEFVVSTELEGIQTILRKAHHIDEAAIKKYRSR